MPDHARLPSPTVRLRLTLLYGGLFLVSGAVLLAVTYLLFRSATGVNLIVPTGPIDRPARLSGPDARKAELRRHDAVAPASTPTRSTRGSSRPGSCWRS